MIQRKAGALAATTPADWQAALAADPAAGTAGEGVTFVLGYPRSGNTLVENILASVPGVAALEERPTLAAAELAFVAKKADYRKPLSASPSQLGDYRRRYYEKATASGAAEDRRWLVDMDPFKTIALPLIARLLPRARVVWVRRDPRDVVWSCFRNRFLLSQASLEFTTLADAARHYAATMELAWLAQERLPLRLQVLDYHRLVTDFDGETRRLCEFTGMPWSEDLRAFDRTARQRGVSTASARQVQRPLYDGRRQWERYARWFEPVMSILQPWIEKFGYA